MIFSYQFTNNLGVMGQLVNCHFIRSSSKFRTIHSRPLTALLLPQKTSFLWWMIHLKNQPRRKQRPRRIPRMMLRPQGWPQKTLDPTSRFPSSNIAVCSRLHGDAGLTANRMAQSSWCQYNRSLSWPGCWKSSPRTSILCDVLSEHTWGHMVELCCRYGKSFWIGALLKWWLTSHQHKQTPCSTVLWHWSWLLLGRFVNIPNWRNPGNLCEQ